MPVVGGFLHGRRQADAKSIGTKAAAEKYQRKIEGELAAGVYQTKSRVDWKVFRAEYEKKILPNLAPNTRQLAKTTLDHFERIVKPGKVASITTATIDDFVGKRQADSGKKPESKLSPATINRDLRCLKSVFRIAHDWGYIVRVPKFRKVRKRYGWATSFRPNTSRPSTMLATRRRCRRRRDTKRPTGGERSSFSR